ncbi:BnaC06g12720D [Brassica napus]|uniref:BnaC06g12720D protein n=1 Tax=Brassica napus TaxID=3708 RepID=A0A078FFD2_BRANA|nr:BnaC06g12720D [Brassica napus]
MTNDRNIFLEYNSIPKLEFNPNIVFPYDDHKVKFTLRRELKIWFRRSTATRLGFVLSVRKKTRADRHHLFSIGEVKSNPFASRQA